MNFVSFTLSGVRYFIPFRVISISAPLGSDLYSKKRVEFVFREELKPLLMSSEKRG